MAGLCLFSSAHPSSAISSQDQTLQPHQADVTYNLAADEYLVVWSQRWSDNDWDIHGARVRGDNGAVVDPPGPFSINVAGEDQGYPAVATNQQDRYLVVWEHGVGTPIYYTVRGQELNISGLSVGGVIQLSAPGQHTGYPAVAINGGTNERFVVWGQPTAAGTEVWGFRWMDPSTGWVIWVPFRIASAADWAPLAVASGPPGYLVAYGKNEGAALHIWGRVYWPEGLFLPVILK